MFRFAIWLTAFASCGALSAGTFVIGYAGCSTKAALDEFTSAVVNNDKRQMNALIGTQCAAVGGFEFSVVDRGLLKTQVRVYVGENSILLWVPSEAAK
ncbi:hypothetical protein [Sulfitobacter pacificus]|uniref:hypothetical protein n=1 Tax=Sulfitobacter pacificus TaxID=1499314 RepID=UPI00310BDB99